MAIQEPQLAAIGGPSTDNSSKTISQLDGHDPSYSEKPSAASNRSLSKYQIALQKRKSKEESLLAFLCATIVEHQLGISINLLLLLFLTHLCFPRARQHTRKFFELSYYEPSTGLYTQGYDDLPFTCFWVVVWTGLRVFIMDYILMPLAGMGGIKKKRARVRFAEQAWLVVYYLPMWCFGMYIMYHSDYWFNLEGLWHDFPNRRMTGLTKWYYLIQFGFWIQQIVVVNIEERRKDYVHMFTHHIITCALIFTSYSYYQTKIGIVILCLMDVVDIFLSTAKDLRYLGYQTACDIMFGIFIVAWFVARHVFYLMVTWSVYVHPPMFFEWGCYNSDTGKMIPGLKDDSGVLKHLVQSFRDPGGVMCVNQQVQNYFLGFLLALQVVTLIWFYMILKVAYKVVVGKGADDVRSDDEGEDEEEVDLDIEDINPQALNGLSQNPLEEEVGVDGLHFTRRGSPGASVNGRAYKRAGNRNSSQRASGISIPGHGDHKELLGRIGCDKPA